MTNIVHWITSSVHENYKLSKYLHVVYINCSECHNKKQFVYTTCSELVVFLYWTCNSMNNLSSYCGLVDARINASDKDLHTSDLYVFSTFQHAYGEKVEDTPQPTEDFEYKKNPAS